MQRIFWNVLAIALLMSSAALAQSLGDVARENRDKKQAEDASGVQPKVITNKDLPKDPDADTKPSEAPSATSAAAGSEAADRSADRRSARQRLAEQRAAEQWNRQILAQKDKVAALQARIDRLHASIQAANGTVQSEGPYNWYQARQLQRVAQIQQQLDAQQKKLDQMQEAARHAGMHSAVYDP